MEAAEYLTGLLDEKDEEIYKLAERVEELENILDGRTWGWTIHTKISDGENMNLPVPRLEMRWRELDDWGYNWEAQYRLVYRHFLDELVAIPFGNTKRGGDSPPMTNEKVDLPFREGAHIKHDAGTLNLPAFVIYGDEVHPIEQSL